MQGDLSGARLGQYELVGRLGAGAMGVVYRAHQPLLNRYVALKVLSPRSGVDDAFEERFRREARAAAQLDHENILPIFDFGEDRGVLFIVTPLIAGGALSERMGAPMALAYALDTCAALADALDYAHARGVVHRDVKPSNVLLSSRKKPILADFGVAKIVGEIDDLTGPSVAIGTPCYMSPEQCTASPVDGRADQYALAVMLFEMLTGQLPFEGDAARVLLRQVTEPPPRIREFDPSMPAELEEAILRAMAKRPEDRFASCEAFVHAAHGQAAPSGSGTLPLAAAVPSNPTTTGPSSTPPPAAVTTFLFTDVEGSTRLLDRFPKEQPVALARHDAILTAAVARHGGAVLETVGDGYYIAFDRATDAVAAAIEAQLALHAQDWGEIGELPVRMAIHTGEAERRGDNYVGAPLYRCARLLALAHGGQMLVSRATSELVRAALPAGAQLRALGPHRLRDLADPEDVFQLMHERLPSDFPPLRSADSRSHHLPSELTPLLGRDAERSELRALITERRLVTITGPGGTGKTRLACAVAADLLNAFPDGVFFVDLEAASDGAMLAALVGRALQVREPSAHTWMAAIQDHLRDKALLLLLDNFEQLIAESATLSRLLAECPALKILVTSRQRLQVTGEYEYPLGPLPLPGPSDVLTVASIASNDAVALFVDRARAVRPGFALTEPNAPVVAEICRRLEGLPLALELAAARVKVLEPRDLLTKLNADASGALRILTGGPRDASPRHQTLRSAIEWSYRLLSLSEQHVFRALSVFAGGWTAEVVDAVCGDDGEMDNLDVLFSLVEKSLINLRDAAGLGETRYSMLNTIREYAAQQVEALGEGEAFRERHAEHYAALADWAGERIEGPEQDGVFRRLTADRDNLLGALRWASAGDHPTIGLRLVGALWRFWIASGEVSECLTCAERLLASSEPAPPSLRARALSAAGNLAYQHGDVSRATAFHMECLDLRRSLGDLRGTAGSLNNLGLLASERGDLDAATRLYDESLQTYRQISHDFGVALVLSNLGITSAAQGQEAEARARHEESLALRRKLGDRQGEAISLQNLAEVSLAQRDYPSSAHYLHGSLTIYDELGDTRGIAYCLDTLASLLHASGDPEHAAIMYGAAEATRRSCGAELLPTHRATLDAEVDATRAALTPERFHAAYEQGLSYSPPTAVARALTALSPPANPLAPADTTIMRSAVPERPLRDAAP